MIPLVIESCVGALVSQISCITAQVGERASQQPPRKGASAVSGQRGVNPRMVVFGGLWSYNMGGVDSVL